MSLPVLMQPNFVYRQTLAWQLDWTTLWGGEPTKKIKLTRSDLIDYLQSQPLEDEIQLNTALRRLRYSLLMGLMYQDLHEWLSVEEVCLMLSHLADVCIEVALRVLEKPLRIKYGQPEGDPGLWVVAMGKLGGMELNVSSDVDLIYLYEQEGETSGPRIVSNEEYFTQLAKKLSSTLSTQMVEGFVFRVDVRLRPNGDAGPLVCSLAMLEEYFLVQGRTWERMAWCKARLIETNPIQHEAREKALWSVVHPFVFRKYLDFEAVMSIADLSKQIQSEQIKRQVNQLDAQTALEGAVNVKLSRGGIREIEFIAHWFQLTWGGKEVRLQQRPTLRVLEEAYRLGYLSQADLDQLVNAYLFLRRLEHVLQYQQDAQTHIFWTNQPAALEVWAQWMFPQKEQNTQQLVSMLLNDLNQHRQVVRHLFDRYILDKQKYLEETYLQNADKDLVLEGLPSAWKNFVESPRVKNLSPVAQSYLYAIGKHGVNWITTQSQQGISEETLSSAMVRLSLFLETILGRTTYLSLLAQYPKAFERLMNLLTASPWVARFLNAFPMVLDELLQPISIEAIFDKDEFQQQIHNRLKYADDQESQMEFMREEQKSRMLHILLHDISGRLSVERVADALSMVADVCLEESLRLCWQYLRQKHRSAPKIAVLAFGKLGGKELGYGSDLDLVFVYERDEKDQDMSELVSTYAQLVQRLNTWLSAPMRAGILYQTDLRLRPDGGAGLLISEWSSFCEYQRQKAWDWEHQALSRARFVAGDIHLGQAFEALRQEILSKPRDLLHLKQEIHQMRLKMRSHHKSSPDVFDLKHGVGGLIDFEFCVQYWVLGFSGRFPELLGNWGNLALAQKAAELGLVGENQAQGIALVKEAGEAYRVLRAKQHQLRLAEQNQEVIPGIALLEERRAIERLYLFTFG